MSECHGTLRLKETSPNPAQLPLVMSLNLLPTPIPPSQSADYLVLVV